MNGQAPRRADVAHLERVAWPLRGAELRALVAWHRGDIDRAAFAGVLRAEDWPPTDVDELVVLLEEVFIAEWRPGAEGGTA